MARTRGARLARNLFRTAVLCTVLAVFALLGWRMCSANLPDEMRNLSVNDRLRDAYASVGDRLILQHQKQEPITRARNNSGYFSVPRCVFIPEAGQVQVVFRYNNSTLTHLAEDKGLESVPDKSGVYFDVTLLRTSDLTPDNPDDNSDPATLSKERFYPSGEPIRTETSLYTYFLYTFDGVTVDDVTDGVFVDIYYLGDLNYDESPYGTLCIYDSGSAWISDRMTAADRRALAGN